MNLRSYRIAEAVEWRSGGGGWISRVVDFAGGHLKGC